MNKILITGASGFVGSNLNKYLYKQNFLNIVRFDRGAFEYNKQDAFENIDVIIHLAGKAHDLKSVSDPDEYYKANFELTKKLYDGFLASKAKKFIFLSSVKASADSVDNALTEDHPPIPKTHYGKSKLLAEQYIQNQPLPIDKSYYILRPCMIHGPGNKGNLNLLYNFVKKGIPYPLAAFENKRSFLSIENLCFIIKELIENEIESGIYHVADDEPLSTNEVVSILASSINVKPKLWKLPPAIIKFIAKVGDYTYLPFTKERLNKLTESYVVSNKKIKSVINKKLPLTVVEGLKITSKSFNNH
jgi:nucleoside-diphosphate-sugar epimerase